MTLEQLKEKRDKLQRQIDKLHQKDGYLNEVSKHFHLGTVGGSGKNNAKLDQRREASINRSIEAGKLIKERIDIDKQIEYIESGKQQSREQAKENMQQKLRSAQVGDLVLDSAFGWVKVIRVNKNTLTIQTTSGYKEARAYSLILNIKKAC